MLYGGEGPRFVLVTRTVAHAAAVLYAECEMFW